MAALAEARHSLSAAEAAEEKVTAGEVVGAAVEAAIAEVGHLTREVEAVDLEPLPAEVPASVKKVDGLPQIAHHRSVVPA